jgi:hypothetical protein
METKTSSDEPLASLRKIDREDHPPIYVTRTGVEYVKASELMASPVGRAILDALANEPFPRRR